MQYSVIQWLLFFFLYGFLGWIWECLYVSISERKWINRGFLYGAFIPIYGFGAIIIFLVTLPVRDSIPMIFLAGILGSTILEYGTGVVMQKLFQATYWDYGRNRFHLNGYICPLCSLGWGLFSVAQIKILHPLIEPVMLKIPVNTASVMSTILVAVYAADTALSVKSALQMQEKPKNNKMCVIYFFKQYK